MALNLVMLGPPGAGKGTQAERLARARGIPKISTGDMLREAANAGTEIGRRAKSVMDRGELVPDDVITGMVMERLDRPDARSGFVLDGFPRTVAQAVSLDAMTDGRGPLIVVDIVVSEAEISRRLGGRLICATCGADAASFGRAVVDHALGAAASAVGETDGVIGKPALVDALGCRHCGGPLVQRTDDAAAVVLERMKVYHVQTEPLVEYYRKRPTFRSVDGAVLPEAVAAALAAAVDTAAIAVNGVSAPKGVFGR